MDTSYLSQFVDRHHDGLFDGAESLIDGRRFLYASATQEPSKNGRDEAYRECLAHVGALIETQDGSVLSLAKTVDQRRREWEHEYDTRFLSPGEGEDAGKFVSDIDGEVLDTLPLARDHVRALIASLDGASIDYSLNLSERQAKFAVAD